MIDELAAFSARPAEFVAPPLNTPILGRIAGPLQPAEHGSNTAETTLFLGWLPIALAVLWLVVVLRRRKRLSRSRLTATTGGLLAMVLAGFAFAAPSPIVIHARPLHLDAVVVPLSGPPRDPGAFPLRRSRRGSSLPIGGSRAPVRVRSATRGAKTARRGNRLAFVAAIAPSAEHSWSSSRASSIRHEPIGRPLCTRRSSERLPACSSSTRSTRTRRHTSSGNASMEGAPERRRS